MDMKYLKQAGIVIGCAAVGALIAQVCINWMPKTLTLVATIAGGYAGWLLKEKI